MTDELNVHWTGPVPGQRDVVALCMGHVFALRPSTDKGTPLYAKVLQMMSAPVSWDEVLGIVEGGSLTTMQAAADVLIRARTSELLESADVPAPQTMEVFPEPRDGLVRVVWCQQVAYTITWPRENEKRDWAREVRVTCLSSRGETEYVGDFPVDGIAPEELMRRALRTIVAHRAYLNSLADADQPQTAAVDSES